MASTNPLSLRERARVRGESWDSRVMLPPHPAFGLSLLPRGEGRTTGINIKDILKGLAVMRFPLKLNNDLTTDIIGNKLKKIDKFPLVLMLEPTHLCNLACSGCGRIREYADTIQQMMPLDECFRSVDECPAPVVTITGGEPFLYPHIYELIEGILQRGKHIYLCTNGLLLEKALDKMKPHPNFILNVHMDGQEETHDRILERKGAFKSAIEGIKKAKKLGFRLCTNTTIFKETISRDRQSFSYLTNLGLTVSW
jgi:hopanoid biosynthesis associated radical SAM protein HpnH